jgi:hypothetical protein
MLWPSLIGMATARTVSGEIDCLGAPGIEILPDIPRYPIGRSTESGSGLRSPQTEATSIST